MTKNQYDHFKKEEQKKQNLNRDKELSANPPYQKGREGNTGKKGETCSSGSSQDTYEGEGRKEESSRPEKNKEGFRSGQQTVSRGKQKNYWDAGGNAAAENADESEEENEGIENTSNRSDRDEDSFNPERNVPEKQDKKSKINTAQAPSLEDWEGGGSRPKEEGRGEENTKNKKNRKAA